MLVLSWWNWAILQICFCTLNMKYTSSILLEIFWFPKFVTLKNNLNLYVSSILWVHQEFNSNYTSSILKRGFELHLYSFLGQKYTWSRLSKLTNLHSKLEVYLKYTFWIDAFFSDSSIFDLDFQTQKYTSSRLSK